MDLKEESLMKIVITGGTGLVGQALTSELIRNGHNVVILTRKSRTADNQGIQYVRWLNPGDKPEEMLDGTNAIVNLAGATINGRWTEDYKQKILDSRLDAAAEITRIISSLKTKPEALINASAVGFYGTSEDEVFTETSPAGKYFLASTTVQWEAAAMKAGDLGLRVVLSRFGVILDKNGGALPRMAQPYKLFAGGRVGSGSQWLSWIHIEDVVQGIIFAIKHPHLAGPVNFTAPSPVRMEQFGKTLSNVMERPHWFPVPSFMLKLLLGEMSMLVLQGQRAIPEKLLTSGYAFRYPELNQALKNIFDV